MGPMGPILSPAKLPFLKIFRQLPLLICCFCIFALSIITYAVQAQPQAFAQGNLFIVFHPKSGRSSEQSPQLANLSPLWCQATSNGNDRLPIKRAQFVHVSPKPTREHPARLNGARERAFLDFGLVPISAIGKYRCEITTDEEKEQQINGNLFVYMRPIFVFNRTMRLEPAEEGNHFQWIGPPVSQVSGDEAVLNCPAIGYPPPRIIWFKNDILISNNATLSSTSSSPNGISTNGKKYLFTGQSLKIRALEADDEGDYKCIANNSFQLTVDGNAREFNLSLTQHLRVKSALSWLQPLIVILICLLLLVLIIWGTSKWKQYNKQYKQYNVAQKEKEFGQKGVDSQRLPVESEEVEE